MSADSLAGQMRTAAVSLLDHLDEDQRAPRGGPLTPGARHYYRVQGGDLLIEYDTTDDGNHVHTVLRRPRGDFGGDVLAAHYARDRR